MTLPPQITRAQLQATNQRTLGYTLAMAEKDYFLAVALALLADSPLRDVLVFKGGTALHHCYLPQYRFSEDVDFTSSRQDLALADVKSALERDGRFEVRKEYVSTATIKIERLRYPGILGQSGAIKVEIDQVQSVVLPPQVLPYRNVWNLPIDLPVMDIREICAEKIWAASQRSRYRDFYDLFLIFEAFPLEFADILTLVRQKEVRRVISSDAIHANWRRAAQEFADGFDLVPYARTIADADLGEFVTGIQFDPILP
jgi:predicted nucleotidyltransferase component of viral defense system